MATDEKRSKPTTPESMFRPSLRIDEQWFEALRGDLGNETDS